MEASRQPQQACILHALWAVSTIAERTGVHRSAAHLDGRRRCDRCRRPAVPVAGANGRYYCLMCHQHLPYKPAA